jgi:SulP family sulfate permease
MTARKLAKIWGVSRTEWVLAAITFLGVIFLDVLAGMVIGMVASILLVLYKTSKPHVASLGRVPGTPSAYSDLARHPENEPVERVAIVRVDASLYYANARTARDGMKAIVSATEPPARAVVFDAAGQDELDVTSATVLGEIAEEWKKDGIAVFIAEAHAPLVEFARRAGLSEVIGQDRFLPTLDAAVRAAEAEIARPGTAAEAADPS